MEFTWHDTALRISCLKEVVLPPVQPTRQVSIKPDPGVPAPLTLEFILNSRISHRVSKGRKIRHAAPSRDL